MKTISRLTKSTDGADAEILLNATHPEARQLFDLAIQIKELQPWQWMEETDLVGIENPTRAKSVLSA